MEYLVFVGVVTNQCVETSVREAADWGYRCVLVEDACAALTESLHVAAIRALRDSYAKIRTTEDVLEEIESL
jgi:nicotinamidase-related amidase